MTVMDNKQSEKEHDQLEQLIENALKKVEGNQENELCKFLPGPSGGYMHHFTLKKLKNSDPQQLFDMLQKFVINAPKPKILAPKPRAPRGSRKKREVISFTRTDIEKVLDLARKLNDQDLLARFSPKRSLPALKRELIRSIRENRVETELWTAYVESMSLLNSTELS
jgi:hypothetical protein